MFLKFCKSGQPVLLFFIPVFSVLLWLKYFILPQPVGMSFEPNPMPFYSWVISLLADRIILSKIIALVLINFTAIWISRINTKFILLQQRTYLPSIIFLLLVSSYLPLQQLSPVVFAALFLVLSIEIMFDTFKKEGLALEFFRAAFLVSIASLFYARSTFLMLVIWTALSILRPLRWREWVFTFLGFLTPYVFLFSWYYLTGQDLAENWEKIRYNFVHYRDWDYLNIFYLGYFFYVLLLIVLASRMVLGVFQQFKIYIRKFFRLNFWIFVFVLAVLLTIYSGAIEMIFFLAVPVTYILSYYFLNIKSKLFGEILFGLLLSGYGILLIFN